MLTFTSTDSGLFYYLLTFCFLRALLFLISKWVGLGVAGTHRGSRAGPGDRAPHQVASNSIGPAKGTEAEVRTAYVRTGSAVIASGQVL